MGLLGLFKKKEVPEELPELTSSEIEKNSNSKLEEDKNIVKDVLKESPKTYKPLIPSKKETNEQSTIKTHEHQEPIKPAQIPSPNKSPKPHPSQIPQPIHLHPHYHSQEEIDQSFFNELQKNLTGEITNIDKLERWYKNKFLPRDILEDMKEYWESQNAAKILQILGRDFKERIEIKIRELKALEKDWQDIYFDLIEKEGEIKTKEQELKKLLAEFVELSKSRLKK